jgi:2-phosphosulfolactate phosphatase
MSQHLLRVHNLPKNVDQRELEGSTAIVIDLLRATTTICCALAAGASEVVPFRTVEETLAAAEKAGRDQVVLGGERGGRRIEGFDLGNSPAEYTPAIISGRSVFITTTNGTQALYHARLASRVILGSFLNLSAVIASVKYEPRVDILCAGTDGCETREDILTAGAIVERISTESKVPVDSNDATTTARAEWDAVIRAADTAGRSISDQLALELRHSAGGRNLIDIGLDQDLIDCTRIDRLNVVPELDVHNWRITSRQSEKRPR